MREIIFRVKEADTGVWRTKGVFSYFIELNEIEIDIDTVGQYTGLKDRNGVKIFEGDIVKSVSCMDEVRSGEVMFQRGQWVIDEDDDKPYPLYHLQDDENGPTLEVLGNVHDVPF